MIFIANTLILNGGTTFLRRITRAYHERGHKVLVLVIQGPVPRDVFEEMSEFSTVMMFDEILSNMIPFKLYSTACIFVPFDSHKIKQMVEEYGCHIHVMGIFGLFSAMKIASCNKLVRISAGIYHLNEYFLRGKSNGISRKMIDLFKKLPKENVINFNDYGVKEYSKIMGLAYLEQNIVPIGILPVDSNIAYKPIEYKIVSVGNLVGFKKYNEHIIKLLPSLRIDFPLVKYEIYGDGPERNKLSALADSLDLFDNVTFHGSIPYHEFRNVTSTASVFVGSGTAILEAAVLGIPSIVGIESIADPVTYGFIYECEGFSYNDHILSRQTVSIEAKLREVFEGTPRDVDLISTQCRNKANEFTIDQTLEGFCTIQQGLLPISNSLTLVDIISFSFWMSVTIFLDLFNIDKSFRFRRDLT